MKNVLKSVEKIQAELEAIKKAVLDGAETEAETTSAPDLDNLDSLKLPDLKKIADDAGIEYGKKPTKKTLIEAILAFYEGEEEDEDEEEEEEDADDEDESEDDEDEDDSDDEDDEDEEDEEEGEEYSEEDLEELDDEELAEVAEEFELEIAEFQKGKGKKKKLDRSALIEAILEAQEEADEDEEEDEDEDESDEDSIEFLEDEELEELDTEELQAHYNELAEYMDEEEIDIPKAGKLKAKAKDTAIRKAILALYDAIEESEEEEE